MKKSTRSLFLLLVVALGFAIGSWHWTSSDSLAANGSYDLRSLKILARTVLHIQANYLDQDKVHPKKMLLAGLDNVERMLPEVVVSPAPGEDEEDPAAILVKVGASSNVFDVGNLDSLWSMREKLKLVMGFVQDHLDDPDVKLQDVEYAVINGILSTLDPHSVLLDPTTYREMKVSTHGEFGGLGIVISIRDHELTIISPIEDTPAWRAGLKAKDKIVQIEDESTVNMRLDEAVKRLRGKVGTPVTIWVKRRGWSEARKFTIVREKITIKSVTSKLLDGGVGYVKLKGFQGHARDQIRQHLERMRAENHGDLAGVILDLRGNPGGLLDQAIKISDLFLDSGTIVLTVGKGNRQQEEHTATFRGTERHYPMAVLVGPGSASASEIVAGALQNNDRAVVMGNTTFGKGSVQVLYDMDDGSALKLTIAQYLTPGRVSIQGVGIEPDIEVMPVSLDDKAVHFYATERFGEGDLDAHLTNDATRKKGGPEYLVRYMEETKDDDGKEDQAEDEDEVKEDFLVRFAQGFLLRAGQYRRGDALSKGAGYVREVTGEQTRRITGRLKELGVDWSEGTNPDHPALQVTFTTNMDGNRVSAGDTIILEAKVRNESDAPVFRIRAETTSDNDYFNGIEFMFGKIPAHGEATWEVPVEIGKQEDSRTDLIRLEVYSGDHDQVLAKERLLVEVQELPKPHFSYTWQIVDDSHGNGDGEIQRGEKVSLVVYVHNTGKGTAPKTVASLINKSGEAVFLEKGRVDIDPLDPGARGKAEFVFQVRPKLNKQEIELKLDLFDMDLRTGVDEDLTIPVLTEGLEVLEAKGLATAPKAGADVYVAPHDGAFVMAKLLPGKGLPVVGKVPGWYKVRLDKHRPGWVRREAVAVSRTRRASKDPVRLLDRHSSPLVRLDEATLATRVVHRGRVKVSGVVEDDVRVKDMYVVVQFRKGKLLKSRKVTYLVNGSKDPARMPFSVEVPLVEGQNVVTVVARDQDKLTTYEPMRVLRLTE